jgi:hypothetical protein
MFPATVLIWEAMWQLIKVTGVLQAAYVPLATEQKTARCQPAACFGELWHAQCPPGKVNTLSKHLWTVQACRISHMYWYRILLCLSAYRTNPLVPKHFSQCDVRCWDKQLSPTVSHQPRISRVMDIYILSLLQYMNMWVYWTHHSGTTGWR